MVSTRTEVGEGREEVLCPAWKYADFYELAEKRWTQGKGCSVDSANGNDDGALMPAEARPRRSDEEPANTPKGLQTTKADAFAARFYRADVSPAITELLKSESRRRGRNSPTFASSPSPHQLRGNVSTLGYTYPLPARTRSL